jgi:hypothetical protein
LRLIEQLQASNNGIFIGIWIDTSPETPRFTKIKNKFQINFEISTKTLFRLSKNVPKRERNHEIYSLVGFLVYLGGF